MAQLIDLVPVEEDVAQIKRLRLASMAEATTLLILLAVAVPLKHALGYSIATRIMGPMHGVAFVAYAWCLMETVSAGGWSRSEIVRLTVAAFIPFGGFLNGPLLRKKQKRIRASLERSR
jgi:integral membrane protein